jgi:hypothetical protein
MKTSIQMFCTPNVLCRARGFEGRDGRGQAGSKFSESPVRKCEGAERSSAFAALAIEDVQPGRVDMHGSDVSRRAGVLRQGVLCQ